jgi:hypothetical protein
MLRLWLTFVLAIAPAVAWADSAATDRAQATETAAEQKAGALGTQRAQVMQQFQHQTDAIDRLKKEKASWRRDRELRSALADSADTANQLAALDKQLAAAREAVAKARVQLAQAIDAELAAGATGPRAQMLTKMRAQLGSQTKAPKKIVIPDAEIDPLADPEDLDKQAADLKHAEQELAHEVAGLDVQAKELAEVADLRKHHERAIDMSRRDDDQPFRTAQRSTEDHANPGLQTPSGNGAGAPGGGAGGAGGTTGTQGGGGAGSGSGAGSSSGGGANDSLFGGDRGSSGAFEAEATVVLADVLDHATIDGMTRASRSGDPAQRAEAAKRARDAVKTRLDQLAKKRAAVESRAKSLRQK